MPKRRDTSNVRRKAEEQPRSAAQLQAFLNVLPAYTWYAAPSGALTFVNKRTAAYLGLPKDHPLRFGIDVGARWDDWVPLLHPDDREKARKYWCTCLRTGEAGEHSYRVRSAEGDYRWFLTSFEPLRASDGTLLLWLGATLDIEELKSTEQALRESEAKIRRLVDANIIGIFEWDFEGRILEANDAFLRMVDYDREDVVSGRVRWTDLTPPDWRDRDARLVQDHKMTGSLQPFEKEYFRKDGSRVPVLIGVATFEEGGDQGVAFVLDMTERKRAEERLRVEHTVAQILAEAATIEEATRRMLWAIGECLGWDVGALWRVNREPEALRCVEFWHKASIEVPEFERFSREFTFVPGLGLPGRVWSSLEPEYIRDVVPDQNFPRGPIAEREGLHAAFGFPILLGGEILGVIEFFSREIRQPDQELLNMLAAIGTQIGQFIERKRAEQTLRDNAEALRRSEAHLAEAQRLSHTGTWAFNETTTLFWSEESYRIWGFDPLHGFPDREAMWQRIHPDDRERVRQGARDARRQKRDYAVEFRILLPDGTVRYLEATARFLSSDSGERFEVVGTHVDVTERRRAVEALRESEARARSAIDGIAGLVVILAPNGEVEAVNHQVLEYFGRSLEWLKNWGTNDTLHPEDLPRIAELRKRALAAGIPFDFELRLRRFDGEYRWFETRHVPIRDDSGRIVRWYALATDIEDRTRALAQLEQMQSDFAHMNRVNMMGELAASLCHEIVQPIASARNNARAAQNFLDMRPPDLAEVREALNCVVGDSDRAGDIVDRIRDHIKKAPPRKERFDLNEAINEVMVLGRSAIIKNGVSAETRLAEGLFPIHGDRVQLQQVMMNLLLNAVEAMGASQAGARDLLISTEQDREGVLVAVRDSGPGIDTAYLERVFDPFYTTKSRGMGMGLSICRSIIETHGGRLWASVCQPHGTLFQFTIPARPA
jgi:PAS domain S-box-containing protein